MKSKGDLKASPFLLGAMSASPADQNKLLLLLEPPVEALGYELVDVEFARHGRGATLRVFIDTPHGVSVDDCARASHRLSEVLDECDPIGGAYALEVSSPGFDRVLRTRSHFERAVGEQVAIELKDPLDGRRRFAGLLVFADERGVLVRVDGEEFSLNFDWIKKARLKPA